MIHALKLVSELAMWILICIAIYWFFVYAFRALACLLTRQRFHWRNKDGD